MAPRLLFPPSPLSRRHFLSSTGQTLATVALAQLLSESASHAEGNPGLPGLPHFPPKAKRVIFLFMSGGLSQLESFDYKPTLNQRQGEEIPKSVLGSKTPLGMSQLQAHFPLVGSAYRFAQHGQSGAWISDQFPHLSGVADELCFIKSLYSEAVNHDPALTFIQTGAPLPLRPSMGAWVTYGLGSDNRDLPAYISLVSNRPADQPLSSRLWDSGFLPSRYQGVQFRSGNEPVLYLKSPAGIDSAANRRMLDKLKHLHEAEHARVGDPEIQTRIDQFEMAYRMQSAVPEAVDLKAEPESVRTMYGPDVEKAGSFAANCLLARRLAQRGVRFIQLFHPGWDHHGGLPSGYMNGTQEIDQACAALIKDLKQQDMLKDTLVVFGTEFGRTSYSQGSISKTTGTYGREHHRDCFTFWLAGGGVKPGITFGETDEFGFNIASDPMHVNDLHATMLHLLGIDHERLTFPFQGRDYRLTDVAGKVAKSILA
ncbi:MAG: DUF1501 domain-containing protein [Verrucomicrobiaceae bacterium]|nr:DUF1501 domain-containing protein [Verrucomicrobiaceae bacterium]